MSKKQNEPELTCAMLSKAYTLVELLVVISVTTVLMAVLMPVLARARQQSRSILCQSNLRQLSLAAYVYAGDNDGYYPVSRYQKNSGSVNFEYCWDFTTITEPATGEVKVVPGLLWQGQTIEQIQQCPSFRGESCTRADPYTGYNYNSSYIGHGEGARIELPAKINQVKKPSLCALFGDGQWQGGANKFMRSPLLSPSEFDYSLKAAGTQGYRHGGRTNVVWCDGHTSSQKEYYTETAPPEKAKIELYNNSSKIKTGFLSPDNSAYDIE